MTEEQGTTSSLDEKPQEQKTPPPNANLYLIIGALIMAFAGQYYFFNLPGKLWEAGFFFAIGILLFAIVAWRVEDTRPDRPIWLQKIDSIVSLVLQHATPTLLLTIASAALAYTAVNLMNTKGNVDTYWDVFTLWAVGGFLYALAFLRRPQFNGALWLRTYKLEIVCAVVLTLLAGFLRFYQLGQTPNIVSGDEGKVGTLTQAVLDGQIHNMMATVYGQSTMYLFSLAGIARLLGGLNMFTLRFASALIGTLTVPILYIFARRFFNARVAFIAAALLAVSHIHVHYSRIIVASSIQDAFFTTLFWFLFLSGIEVRSRNRFVLAGLILGVFLYIYMGARLTIALVPVYLIALLITNRDLFKGNLVNLLIFSGAFIVIAAPMGYWAFRHPDEFNARMNQIGVVQSGWLAAEALRTNTSQIAIFAKLLRDAFLSINYYPAKAFYYSDYPMLDFISAAIFMLGLVYSLFHVRDKRYLLLNGWFWSAVLIGGALVVLPALSVYRILMILPAVCILVAVGWEKILDFAGDFFAKNSVRVAAIVAIIALTAALNIKYYFVDYAFTCRYEDPNTRLASYVGQYYGQLPAQKYEGYLVVAPRVIYGVYPSVDFFTHNAILNNVQEPITAPTFKTPAVFFFTPDHQAELATVQQFYPGGKSDTVTDCGETILYIYLTP
jgi:hypothetical protein